MLILNLVCTRGDGVDFRFRVIDPVTKLPEDIRFAKLWFTGKLSKTLLDADATFQKTEVSGIIVDNNANGGAMISLVAADTLPLPMADKSVLEVDLQVQQPGGQPRTVAEGLLVVKPGATENDV